LDLTVVFGNDHAIELEVGCGKCVYVVTAAAERPHHNFLALELDRALYYYVAGRLARRGLGNARIACTDARVFLRDRLPDGALIAIHVYFPDPWWKKRHHKRRVWTPEFAADCVRTLSGGGLLLVATDVPEYAETIRGLLDSRPELVRDSSDESAGHGADEGRVTNFERKALVRGGTVWRAEYRRIERVL
jgi:tRNA (guanine-N7-)-methyltransferase